VSGLNPLQPAPQPIVPRASDPPARPRRRLVAQMTVAVLALALALAALGARGASAATPWQGGSLSSGFSRTVVTEP
jgi:hypothetical protein